jgi:hypothetical protein
MCVILQRIDATEKIMNGSLIIEKKNNQESGMAVLYVSIMLSILFLIFVDVSYAGTYLSSAHGNSSYGVDRSGAANFPNDYNAGLCAHCHEQHASFDGNEPDPAGGSPSYYLLFSDNHTTGDQTAQANNFCFQCHIDVNSFQTGDTLLNRSYSYRAGGWTSDTVDNILEQFSFDVVGNDSSHNLDDILTFITGETWEYTTDSNPCAACHNPHAAQGDPANSANSTKSSGSRGWPVSRPSQHDEDDNDAWGLWGDVAGERMDVYAGASTYMAPHRFGVTTHEPDGTNTDDGSNLTDFVSLCTDCHDNANVISSSDIANPTGPPGRNLNTFDWNIEKHGKGAADNGVPAADTDTCSQILEPYLTGGQCGAGDYVLACTDCHEPHGSQNILLIRKEVNSATVTVDTFTGGTPANTEWMSLCNKCHDIAVGDARHDHPAVVPGGAPGCSGPTCHGPLSNQYPICTNCHNHGNSNIVDFFGTTIGAWGDQLF